MKLRLLAIAMAVLSAGAAVAQDVTSDKGKLSYSIGYDLGNSLTERKVDVDLATLYRAIQDGIAHRNPAVPAKQMADVMQTMQQRLLAQAKAAFDKAATENKAAGDWFLAKNHARAYVKTLANGIQYRVIEEGNGPTPRADGQVRIMYKASISTGQVFAANYGDGSTTGQPTMVSISALPLAGIRQVLPMMKQGAHWEVVMPPEQAYGSGPDSPIGPNQVVIFDIKMIEVLK
jgi:FKBP-type peptidyl-prolyl cis-trans isomerase